MPKIQVNGVTLHYIAAGTGPDVVMLHGFLGNLAVWHLQIVPQLAEALPFHHLRPARPWLQRGDAHQLHGGRHGRGSEGLLDALGIERPILVGHSFGADICMYFALLYPERVPKMVALEPGLAALVHERKDKDWVGWSAWVAKLEEVGLTVPEDKRTDAEFLLKLSLETPKFYGPARGLPRNREPLLRLIRETTLVADYDQVGELTLEAVRPHPDPHVVGLRRTFAFHQLLRVSARCAAQLQAGAAARRGAFRPARAARAAHRTHPGFSSG